VAVCRLVVFFRAEDGIRDFHVTGVQTCALPICQPEGVRDVDDFSMAAWVEDLATVVDALGLTRFPLLGLSQGASVCIAYAAEHQIGRASCRERSKTRQAARSDTRTHTTS